MSADPNLPIDSLDEPVAYTKISTGPALTYDELKAHAEANSGKISETNPNFGGGQKNGISLDLDLDDKTGNREISIETVNMETETVEVENPETKKKEEKIIVKRRETTNYIVTVKQARMSDVLAAALDKDPEANEIIASTRNNKWRLFGYVQKYMKNYNGVKQTLLKRPFKSDDFKVCTNNLFDAELAEEVWVAKDIFDLIMYCNYIGMTELVHLMCGILAHKMKGKSEGDIRDIIKDQAEHADEIPRSEEEKRKEREEEEKREREEKEKEKEEKKEEL
jgi:hypothetical protein